MWREKYYDEKENEGLKAIQEHEDCEDCVEEDVGYHQELKGGID
jgi:hypothetical protein